MENRKRWLVELIFALIFVAILLIVSIYFIDNSRIQEEKTPINTYNFNIYNTYISQKIIITEPGVKKTYINRENNYFSCHTPENICDEKISQKNWDYSSYGGKSQEEDFLGSYITEYRVYVSNKERTGEYFTVTFNFEDQWGFEYSESITQYLKAGEKKLFLYRDVQSERREIVSWNYEVRKE